MSRDVIYTTHTAAFDKATGQLNPVEHFYLNPTVSYTQAFPRFSLFFPPPPLVPYAHPKAFAATEEKEAIRKKKKRKLDSGVDWEIERIRSTTKALANPARARSDKATTKHHEHVLSWLKDAWAGIREMYQEDGLDGSEGREGVIWKGNPGVQVNETDWAGLLLETRERDDVIEPLPIDSDVLHFDLIVGRIVTNSAPDVRSVSLSLNSPGKEVQLVVPAGTSFLISDFATWSRESSGIAAFGRARGGWDLVVIE